MMFEQFNKETLAKAMERANKADKGFVPLIKKLTPKLAEKLTKLIKGGKK